MVESFALQEGVPRTVWFLEPYEVGLPVEGVKDQCKLGEVVAEDASASFPGHAIENVDQVKGQDRASGWVVVQVVGVAADVFLALQDDGVEDEVAPSLDCDAIIDGQEEGSHQVVVGFCGNGCGDSTGALADANGPEEVGVIGEVLVQCAVEDACHGCEDFWWDQVVGEEGNVVPDK